MHQAIHNNWIALQLAGSAAEHTSWCALSQLVHTDTPTHNTVRQSKLTPVVSFLIFIQEMLASNLGQDTDITVT
jgi:hypothetical protein